MICIDGNEKYEIAIYFTTFLLYGQRNWGNNFILPLENTFSF